MCQIDIFDTPEITVCPECGDNLEILGGTHNWCEKCQMHYAKDFDEKAEL